jgi:hypothetical protein
MEHRRYHQPDAAVMARGVVLGKGYISGYLAIRPSGFVLWTIVSERDDPPETQHPGEGSVAPRLWVEVYL